MGFLDDTGLSRVWSKIESKLNEKQNTIATGNGLSKDGNTLNVDLPTKSVTKAEYDAMTEAEKQAEALYLIESSIADAPGLGGMVPPGAIIPFMGLRAPSGYLVCDGAEHSISQYPHLAQYFEEQFGTKNHFGGNGTTTFAVPDMRNLFLRGYHGEAEEALSGEIGAKQEATEHLYFESAGGTTYGIIAPRDNVQETFSVKNEDAFKNIASYYGQPGENSDLYAANKPKYYTSRPVNMAVLYCVKI